VPPEATYRLPAQTSRHAEFRPEVQSIETVARLRGPETRADLGRAVAVCAIGFPIHAAAIVVSLLLLGP